MQAKQSWVAVAVGLVALAIAIGLTGLVGPASANAAITVGSNLASPANSGHDCSGSTCQPTESHLTLPASSTASGGIFAPINGVVVRWRIKTGANVLPVAFRITRPGSSNTRTGAGTGPTVTPAANTTSTYDLRLPIQVGDAVGINRPMGLLNAHASTTGATYGVWLPQLQDGESPPRTALPPFPNEELLVNADLEPDADADGFGDETQDQCPAQAGPNNGCPDPVPVDSSPPNATITKGPKDKTRKKTATFEFTGTDAKAVASFQCSLDGAAFATCTSPYTVRVKKGKHTFQVRAIDQAGNVGTPASDSWKRKKKKKK